VDDLLRKFEDFRRAYEEDGMAPAGFDTFGATVRTLRQFIAGYESLVHFIRERLLPNPDLRKAKK